MSTELLVTEIGRKIHRIRGRQVMMDCDLADLYGVETRVVNQAVKRNPRRFPGEDFLFQVTKDELEQVFRGGEANGLERRKYLPLVFTEHGVAMLSGTLNTDRAIEVHLAIVDFFVVFRRFSGESDNLSKMASDLGHKLGLVEKKLDELMEKIVSSQTVRPRGLPLPRNSNSKAELILSTVASEFSLKGNYFHRIARNRDLVLPRQIAMYLLRKHTALGLRDIGKYFAGKDHTTVMHACKKVMELERNEQSVAEVLERIDNAISHNC